MPLAQPPPLLDELLNETLDRIRGGNIESGWWQGLLDRFGQRYVAPDFLRKPALQEWLVDESVVDDLKAIAKGRIMSTAEQEGPHFAIALRKVTQTEPAREPNFPPGPSRLSWLSWLPATLKRFRLINGQLQGWCKLDSHETMSVLTALSSPCPHSSIRLLARLTQSAHPGSSQES